MPRLALKVHESMHVFGLKPPFLFFKLGLLPHIRMLWPFESPHVAWITMDTLFEATYLMRRSRTLPMSRFWTEIAILMISTSMSQTGKRVITSAWREMGQWNQVSHFLATISLEKKLNRFKSSYRTNLSWKWQDRICGWGIKLCLKTFAPIWPSYPRHDDKILAHNSCPSCPPNPKASDEGWQIQHQFPPQARHEELHNCFHDNFPESTVRPIIKSFKFTRVFPQK
jgi:hypothetical protein